MLLKWKIIAPLALTAAGAVATGIAVLKQKLPPEAPAADNGVMNNRVFAADAAVGKALPEDELLCQISDRDGPICTLPVSELPEGLLSMNRACFRGTPLRSVTIPGTVEAIDQWAFMDCSNLVNVIFENTEN